MRDFGGLSSKCYIPSLKAQGFARRGGKKKNCFLRAKGGR